MLGTWRIDNKRNTWMKSMTRVVDIVQRVKILKWQRACHVTRRMDKGRARLVPERKKGRNKDVKTK